MPSHKQSTRSSSSSSSSKKKRKRQSTSSDSLPPRNNDPDHRLETKGAHPIGQDPSTLHRRRRCSTSSPQLAEVNPFARVDDEKKEEDALVMHVLNFAPNTENKEETVEALVDYLLLRESPAPAAGTTKSPNHPLLSRSDVAQLLLPWSLQQVQHEPPSRMVWRALSSSLSTLVENEEHNGNITTILSTVITQSVLFKLVPRISLLAVDAVDPMDIKNTEIDIDSHRVESWGDPFTTYRILLKLFHPTLEVACKKILLPILTATLTLRGKDRVLRTTLQWIRSLHQSRQGNPKTTFQLLADRSMITALARVLMHIRGAADDDNDDDNTIRDLWWDGLFHPQHHMEGWVALLKNKAKQKKRKANVVVGDKLHGNNDAETGDESPLKEQTSRSSFRTYHEDLLEVIADCLSSTSSSIETDRENLLHVVSALPVLLRGFFEQSKKWDQRERMSSLSASGNKKVLRDPVESLAIVQFQLFQQWVSPLLAWIDASMPNPVRSTQALRSLQEMLQLVLDYDAYVPSSHQDGESARSHHFLEQVAKQVLRISEFDAKTKQALLPDSIRSLRTLLQLNHLLLESRIVDVMALCLQYGGGDISLLSIPIDFFTTFVDTYRLLRQQRLIFTSIFGAMEVLTQANDQKGLVLLDLLLERPEIASAFAVAIQNCPITEAKELIKTTNRWITERCEATIILSDDTALLRCTLSIAVRLASFLLRNILVDQSTSAGVVAHSQMFVADAVSHLAELGGKAAATEFRTIVFSASLTLCGFALGLHTRCVFWLGRNEELQLPGPVRSAIESVKLEMDTARCGPGDHLASALVTLWCHRLREIHSQIYEEDRAAMENSTIAASSDSNSENTSNMLTLEATNLAFSIGRMAEVVGGRQWIVVAQNFNAWVSYADQSHIHLFLRWVIASASGALERQMRPESWVSKSGAPSDDEEAVFLLNDSSFFEHDQVSHQISAVGLSVACDRVALILSLEKDGKKNDFLARLVLPRSKETSGRRSTGTEIQTLLKCCTTIQTRTVEGDVLPLERALYPILLVNGINGDFASDEDALDFLDTIMGLEHVCRSLCSTNLKFATSAVSVITALRNAASKLSLGPCSDAVISFLCSAPGLSSFVCNMISSSLRLVTILKEAIRPENMRDFLDCTGDWIERTAQGSPPLSAEAAKRLWKGLSELAENAVSELEAGALSGMVRRLLEGLRFTEWPSLYPQNHEDEANPHLTALLKTVYAVSLDSLQPLLRNNPHRKHVPDLPTTCDARLESFLLLGDLLRFQETKWLPNTCDLVQLEMQELCIHALGTLTGESISNEWWNALCYLIGCISHCKPSHELLSRIVDVLVSETDASLDVSVLDACFCHAIPSFPHESLRSIAEHVLKLPPQSGGPSIASRIRLLRFLLRYTEQKDQIEILSTFGWDMLMLVLRALHRKAPDETDWADHVVGASALAEDLVKRRDVITFRERDIALLLSYICTTLGPAGGTKDSKSGVVVNNVAEDEGTVVYSALAGLFTTVFQRYTKQLYACVPSAISVLHCFLRHAMYYSAIEGSSPSSEAVSERGQRFARVCEQLVAHKDIYKKHVIGLVLEFVHDGLGQSSIDLHVRNSLIPAIYSLLDTMSTYEMRQLDAHMDTKAKVLFRGIHQGYQKVHAYRGQ